MKKYVAVIGSALTLGASSAFATPDLTPITTAQSDMLAYAGGILALVVAVWAAMKAVGLFRR